MTDKILQVYFKFDDSDLEANRRDQFSEKQKARLSALNKKERVLHWVLGVILFGIAILDIVIAPTYWHDPTFPTMIFPIGLFAGIIGLFVLWGTKKADRKYRLKKIQGRVSYSRYKPRTVKGKQYNNRIIHLDNSHFDVAEDTPAILKEGTVYAVYTYAFQGSTNILSAERIDETNVDTPNSTSAVSSA
jgi:hypothetical protein